MPRFCIKSGRKSIKKVYYRWRIDEKYIKIKGKWCYLYRAIEADGHKLDIWLRKKWDNHSAYAFIKRLVKQFGKPQIVITNQALSTKMAMAKVIQAFKLNSNCHCTSKYLNNLIEQDIKVSIQQKIQSKGLNVFTLYIKRTVGLFRSTDFHRSTKLDIC